MDVAHLCAVQMGSTAILLVGFAGDGVDRHEIDGDGGWSQRAWHFYTLCEEGVGMQADRSPYAFALYVAPLHTYFTFYPFTC